MAEDNILVVDDEADVTKMISARLKKAGYNVHGVLSGKEAMDYVKTNRPDLMLLDIMMPEMDGYEVASQFRKDPKISLIPIIMLTAKKSTDDKIKSLKMGIEDYITKPYNPDELIARIEAVLRRMKKERPGGIALSSDDRKRIDFLKKMINDKVDKLAPEYNMASLSGYGYPYAAEFFGTTDGSELNHLSFMVDRGCFIKKFFDKILVCPYCNHHDISVREVSPSNNSADISMVEIIHHFRCGYVGAEQEFKRDVRYICPKCEMELRQIGVDYDKPGQTYVCNETGEKFTEPKVYCQCRNCQKFFDVDSAVRQDIFSYTLTDRGKEAAGAGRFVELNLEQALIDQEMNLYNLRYFRKRLADEMERSKDFKRPFSLSLISISGFDRLIKDRGATEVGNILKEIARILKENMKAVDISARYEKNAFITLLLETDKKTSEKLAKLIKEKIDALRKKDLNIHLAVASYPEDATTEDGLIEYLLKNKQKGA